MTIKPEILDALLAAGASADMIVAAVKADMAEAEAKRAAKRLVDRDRQRRHRSRDVTPGHGESRPVTRDGGDTPSLPPSPQTPQPPTHPRDETTRAHEGPAEPVTLQVVASTDWPAGDSRAHAELLIAEAKTVRLDLAREPGLTLTLARLAAWRAAGASWRRDVIPAVTALAGRPGRKITSWKFFDDAVAQSIADNREPLTIPEATPRESSPHVLRASPKRASREANLARALAGAEAVADERAGHG